MYNASQGQKGSKYAKPDNEEAEPRHANVRIGSEKSTCVKSSTKSCGPRQIDERGNIAGPG